LCAAGAGRRAAGRHGGGEDRAAEGVHDDLYAKAGLVASEVSGREGLTVHMRFTASIAARAGIAAELLGFFWRRKWWWLTPMVVLLLLFAALVALGQGSAIAPFIYTLF
jgi:hypothetical protein